MSLYIFLNEEAHAEVAKSLEGYSLAYRTVCLHGINVSLDADGRLHYEAKNETGPVVSLVPIPLRKYVESISWQTHLPPDSLTKTLGRYIHLSAEAIVDHRRDKQGWRTVRISGPVIDDVYQLYFQLRAGTAALLEPWQEPTGAEEPEGERELAAANDAPHLPSVNLSCPKCQAKYTIAGDKVSGRRVKIRCRKCGGVIEVNGDEALRQAEAAKKPVGAKRGLRLVKKPDPDKSN